MVLTAYFFLKIIFTIIFQIFVISLWIAALGFSPLRNTKIAKYHLIFRQIILVLAIPLLIIGLNLLSYSHTKVGINSLTQLAQAEGTLLQLQTTSDLAKKPLPYDRTQGDAWDKDMREAVANGDLTYGKYFDLMRRYNDLGIGITDMTDWFKTNSPDSIHKQLQDNITAMMQRNQGGTASQQQSTGQEQPSKADDSQNMAKQLDSAMQ